MTHQTHEPPRKFASSFSFLLRAAFVFGGPLLLSGCPTGGSLENAEEQLDARGDDCMEPLLEAECGTVACHGPGEDGNVVGGLDLISPGLDARLLDQPAVYRGLDGCPNPPEILVDSLNPELSLMLTKSTNTHDPACGGQPMPPLVWPSGQLEGDDKECYETYILNLANTGVTP